MIRNIILQAVRPASFLAIMLASAATASAQKVYEITAPQTPKQIIEGKLEMGGTSPSGGSIAVNSYYMSRDGQPVIPVMGEFHFSRYPAEQWEEEIVKMKAGGVNVVPTYIFWALHEPREGEFHWEGNLNVRRFVELCKRHEMDVIIRIGPFCHGEMRQGGFPEWVFAKPMEVRADDAMYLRCVERLYNEIGRQLQGLYYKDGGPIIGCQIENELQHSSAPWGLNYPDEPKDAAAASWNAAEATDGVEGNQKLATGAEAGNQHMRSLLTLAKKAGIMTPFYTATGWGNAAVIDNKAIPVTAAYTYPTWVKKPTKSPFMLFKDIHANPDYAPIRYNATDFPSFCAEMGVGIQKVYWSRPVCTAKAAEALMIRTLGSGSNGIGYYMYHGGSTPTRGDNAFASDEAVAVPKISYDFQAPLGEFGLEGVSYRNLRLIHSFLAMCEEQLAPMETVLPAGYDKITPDNTDDVRFAVRMAPLSSETVNGKLPDGTWSGFIFFVNFQDHASDRHDQNGTINLNLKGEKISVPFTLPKDESMILPFNMAMDGVLLKYATAQPLMKLQDGKTPHYIFFAPEGVKPVFVFANGKTYRPVPGLKSTFSVGGIKITCLTRQQALDASMVNGRLVITKATVLSTADGAELLSLGENKVEYIVYPSKHGFKTQVAEVQAVTPDFKYTQRTSRHSSLHFIEPANTPQVQEYFLHIDYTADVAMAFLDGVLCHDEFWQGQPWTIGLKRHAEKLRSQDMTFYFRPLKEQPWVRRDLPAEVIPVFSHGPVLDIKGVSIVPEYKMDITF